MPRHKLMPKTQKETDIICCYCGPSKPTLKRLSYPEHLNTEHEDSSGDLREYEQNSISSLFRILRPQVQESSKGDVGQEQGPPSLQEITDINENVKEGEVGYLFKKIYHSHCHTLQIVISIISHGSEIFITPPQQEGVQFQKVLLIPS